MPFVKIVFNSIQISCIFIQKVHKLIDRKPNVGKKIRNKANKCQKYWKVTYIEKIKMYGSTDKIWRGKYISYYSLEDVVEIIYR